MVNNIRLEGHPMPLHEQGSEEPLCRMQTHVLKERVSSRLDLKRCSHRCKGCLMPSATDSRKGRLDVQREEDVAKGKGACLLLSRCSGPLSQML